MAAEPLSIARLNSRSGDFAASLDALLRWDVSEDSEVLQTAREVIRQVRADGDAAVAELTRRFDRMACESVADLAMGPDEFRASFERIGEAEREALVTAADRIRAYHEHQRAEDWTFTDNLGNRLGQRVTPLERVGIYVPGGQASYPSTVLMTAVPARVAGVGEIVMAVPTPDGVRNDLVLAAAHVADVDRGFCVGGAQAV
ncbi:MAG: histidinol dehydrogenase, partial [Gammaproteobacteria bacterium]